VPSPVPRYTKMAIHRDSPEHSHFSILGHRLSPVYSLNLPEMYHNNMSSGSELF